MNATSSLFDSRSGAKIRYCTFWVGDQHYGLDVDSVREVLKGQSTTSVPAANPIIGGLINLRGEIVTAINLRYRLGLPPREDEGPSLNVVVNLKDEVISLIVDRVGDVVDFEASTLEPVPATVPPEFADMMNGVHRTSDGLVQILNAASLLPRERSE